MTDKSIDIDSYQRLALAAVVQAVKDWRLLCNGKPAGRSNFAELERFFKYDAEMYLHGTGIDAEKLYQKMMTEKATTPKHRRATDGQTAVEAV